MTIPRWWWHAARKDVLALASTWTWCAIAMVAGNVAIGGGAGFFGYFLGSMLLGAQVVGHEYSHRTLPSLLTSPASRRQILLIKFVVLAAMLGALAVVAWLWALPNIGIPSPIRAGTVFDARMALWLPPVCGLCLAPFLTIVARSPLAGAVFSGAILCTMWMVGEVFAFARTVTPSRGPAFDWAKSVFQGPGFVAVCVVGVLGSVLAFARLQSSDGGFSFNVPSRPATKATPDARVPVAQSHRRHWILRAVVKELHLHSLLLVVTLLYVVAWYVMVTARPYLPWPLRLPLSVLTMVYGAAVALIGGSFASAEERHLGTAQWQQLLPVASWRQWMLKTVVLLVLAGVLGIGLPFWLESMTPRMLGIDDKLPYAQVFVLLPMAIGSLYVSSLSKSGLRALVASIAVLSLVTFAGAGLDAVMSAVSRLAQPMFRDLPWRRTMELSTLRVVGAGVTAVGVAWFLGVVLRFAMINHRGAERGVRAIRAQSAWLAALAIAFAAAMGVLDAASRSYYPRFAGVEGVRVSGHAEYAGQPMKFSATQLHDVCIELVSAVPRKGERSGVSGVFITDGGFSTSYTWRDQYYVRVCEVPPGFAVERITHQGRDVSETPLDLRTDVNDVIVTFTDRPGAVRGRVTTAGGQPASDVDVFVFSVDQSHWADHGRASRRVRATSVSDGTFTMTMPRDGEYFLVAVDHNQIAGLRGESPRVPLVLRDNKRRPYLFFWSDPSSLLTKLAPLAERFQAREGETLERNLTVKRLQ